MEKQIFSIKDHLQLLIIKKYFDGTIDKSDSNAFPTLITNTNGDDLLCSLIPGDTSRYTQGGKKYTNAKLTSPIVLQIIELCRNVGYKKVQKAQLCIFVYILKITFYKEKSLYQIMESTNWELFIPIYMHDLLYELLKIIIGKATYDEFLKKVYNIFYDPIQKNADPPHQPQSKKRIQDIINVLANNPLNLTNIKTIKISELYHVSIENVKLNSIMTMSLEELTQYAMPSKMKKVLKNLADLIDLPWTITSLQILQNAYAQYDPARLCSNLDHDEPYLHDGKLFSDYSLDQIQDFVGIDQNCFTISEVVNNILANEGMFKYNEKSYQLDSSKATRFAKYYDKIKEDHPDLIRVVKSYNIPSLTNLVQTNSDTLSYLQLEKIFKRVIDRTVFAPVQDVIDVFISSSNTVFELIGLLGYTYWSDMIIQGGANGNYFQISVQCSQLFSSVLDELDKLNKESPSLRKKLSAIKINGQTLLGIIESLGNTCIHGVGRMCMIYYICSYELLVSNASQIEKTMKEKCTAAHQVLLPIHCQDINESIKTLVPILPILKSVSPELLKKTDIKYLTCFECDNEIMNWVGKGNCFNAQYLVSGFDTDQNMYHLFWILDETHTYYSQDINPSQYLLPKYAKFPYKIREASGIDNNKQDIIQIRKKIVDHYKLNPNELTALISIPSTFARNRIQRFQAFCQLTSSVCRLLSSSDDKEVKLFQQFVLHDNFEDPILMETRRHIPRYLIVLETKPPKGSSNNPNYKITNSIFEKSLNHPPINDPQNHQDNDPKNDRARFHITDLETLVQLPFTMDYIDGKGVAVVKTPDTRQDITDYYFKYKLIGDLYYNKSMSKVQDRGKKAFESFEEYVLKITHQPLQLVTAFTSISKHNLKSLTFWNAGQTLLKMTEASGVDLKILTNILKLMIYMFVGFYSFIAPNYSSYFRYMKDHLKLNEKKLKSSNLTDPKQLVELYYLFIEDLPLIACGEGSFLTTNRFHFTELNNDVYLLKQIRAAYLLHDPDNKTFKINYTTTKQMITVLNNIIYKTAPLSNDNKSVLYTHESMAIAVDYLTKIDLITEHESRIVLLFREMESSIIKCINKDLEVSVQSLSKIFSQPTANYQGVNFTSFIAELQTQL
jgi:hypothetical protein